MNWLQKFRQINLPNKLTMLRVLMIPLFCAFIAVERTWAQWTALFVFALASVTDLLDGYLARKNHQVTDFGKLVDPIADKCLITSAMLFLVAQGRMAAWMCLIFIAREFIISAFRMLAASRGVVIAAGKLGKYKTAMQTAAVCLSIVCLPLEEGAGFLGGFGAALSRICMWLALALAVLSCIDYIRSNRAVVDWENM